MRFFIIFLFCVGVSFGQAVVSAPALEYVQTQSLFMQKLSKIANKVFSTKNIAWLSHTARIAKNTYDTATSVSRFVRNSERFFQTGQSLVTLLNELDGMYGVLDKMGVSKEQQEMMANTNDISRDILGQLDRFDVLKQSGYKMNDFETLSLLDGVADVVDRSRRKIKGMKEELEERERQEEEQKKVQAYTAEQKDIIKKQMDENGSGHLYVTF